MQSLLSQSLLLLLLKVEFFICILYSFEKFNLSKFVFYKWHFNPLNLLMVGENAFVFTFTFSQLLNFELLYLKLQLLQFADQ